MASATAPHIIERASTAAYEIPWLATAKASVAKATEGAAPNKPAKLFGFSTSPSAENTETTSPPTTNLNSISFTLAPATYLSSFLFQGPHSVLHPSSRFAGSFDVENPIFLACKLVIVNEKPFEFFHELLSEVIDVFYVRVAVIHLLDSDDAIVTPDFFPLPCSPSMMPMVRHLRRHPGKAGSSISTRTSVGSPSSAKVEGMNPKS
jgi:hypothetical protein